MYFIMSVNLCDIPKIYNYLSNYYVLIPTTLTLQIIHIALTVTAMGIFHVLSGPDHLSALATLSVG